MPRARAALVSVVAAMGVVAALAAAAGAPPAGATTDPGQLRVRATPTTGLRDGQLIHVVADVDTSVEIYEVKARVCKADVPVTDTWTYSADSTTCPSIPFSGSAEPESSVVVGQGGHHGELDFQIGVGTVNWTDFDGVASSVTCGLGSPCQLVVQLQITNDTVFWSTPLGYASSEQLNPPKPPRSKEPITNEDGISPPPTAAPAAPDGVESASGANPSGPGAASATTVVPTVPADASDASTDDAAGRVATSTADSPARWWWAIAVVVIVAIGAAAVVLRRRRASGTG